MQFTKLFLIVSSFITCFCFAQTNSSLRDSGASIREAEYGITCDHTVLDMNPVFFNGLTLARADLVDMNPFYTFSVTRLTSPFRVMFDPLTFDPHPEIDEQYLQLEFKKGVHETFAIYQSEYQAPPFVELVVTVLEPAHIRKLLSLKHDLKITCYNNDKTLEFTISKEVIASLSKGFGQVCVEKM